MFCFVLFNCSKNVKGGANTIDLSNTAKDKKSK